MTCNSIEYTVNQLFKIANPRGNLRYSIIMDEAVKQVIIKFKESDARIIFRLVEDNIWYDLLGDKGEELKWINNSRDTYKIPVLFWVNEDLPFICIKGDKEVVFNGDIISSSFFMLSRWEERMIQEKDVHGRFRFIDSIAYKHNFITIPIVDEYAMILRKYLQLLFQNTDLGNNKFSIKLSHDIDDIRRFINSSTAIKTLSGDLIKEEILSYLLNQ